MKDNILSQLLIKCPFPEVFEDSNHAVSIILSAFVDLLSIKNKQRGAGSIPLPAPLCLFYATEVQSFSGICFNRPTHVFRQAFVFSDLGHFTNISSSI